VHPLFKIGHPAVELSNQVQIVDAGEVSFGELERIDLGFCIKPPSTFESRSPEILGLHFLRRLGYSVVGEEDDALPATVREGGVGRVGLGGRRAHRYGL
jgi:hypothetical protein